MSAVDTANQPERPHSIPSAAAEFSDDMEAALNESLSECSVLKPTKKRKAGGGENEGPAGAYGPRIDQLQQRLMMSTEVNARPESNQFKLGRDNCFSFFNRMRGRCKSFREDFGKFFRVTVMD
jgi:hypothetical protein